MEYKFICAEEMTHEGIRGKWYHGRFVPNPKQPVKKEVKVMHPLEQPAYSAPNEREMNREEIDNLKKTIKRSKFHG
jgi:hypothetical protein